MTKAATLNRNLLYFGIPFGLLSVLFLLMRSAFFMKHDHMGLILSLDLLVTVPFLYFLLIRKSTIPKTTVVPMMVAGLLIGLYALPIHQQYYLNLFKSWALPVIEIFITGFIIFEVRRAIKQYQTLKNTQPDFYDALKNVCQDMLPKRLVLPFANEVAVFYYGFVRWKTRNLDKGEFSYHQKSGAQVLYGSFIFLIAIETVAVHLLLDTWSPLAAWILTILSLYSMVQILGFAKSLSQRPISIQDDTLMLRYGILSEAQIPFADIATVILSKKKLDDNDDLAKTLSPLGEMESHNVVISLKRENTLIGLYGFKKQFKTIALYVDEPAAFKAAIENTLGR